MMRVPDTPLLTSGELARLLRVHPKHVYRLLARGLPAKRAGGKWLFERDEVLAWAQRRAEPAPGRSAVGEAVAPSVNHPPLLAANGDLVIELLLAEARQRGRGPLVGFVQADRASGLKLLADEQVIAAGCHGHAIDLEGTSLVWLHLVDREVGLVTRARRRAAVSELGRLRLASRPPTAGVREHIDAALREHGLSPRRVHQRALLLGSHREVVFAVARGDADVGLASRAWADRLSLPFTPLTVEPYGLTIRARDLGAPLVAHLCAIAQERGFRSRLGTIAGYSVTRTGDIRFGTMSNRP
jgi:excisionase family DNA binding protein